MISNHAPSATLQPGRGPSDAVEPSPVERLGAARRPRLVEIGVGLVVAAVPLAILPMSAAPFVDVKIVVLLVACLLVWAGRPTIDRRLALVAAVWVGVLALSALTGVDRWLSLAGPDNLANGLILFGPCVYLLVVGASLPSGLVDRIPSWLFLTAVPISVVAIVWRFAPDAIESIVRDLDFSGSTLGHAVLLSGMTAAAIVASVAARLRRSAWFVPSLVVVASAMAISTKRAGLVAVAVGLLIALVRTRPGRAKTWLIAGVVAGSIAVWTVASPFVPGEEPLSGVQRFQELDTDSARARVVITEVLVRGWAERPLLGWGVGNTWSAYLTNATEDEVELARRGVADAHNIVLGAAVTTGAVGLAAFLALVALILARAWRGPRRLGWAIGVASALFVVHLLQPASAPLTPLLFLLAGVAAGRGRPLPVSSRNVRRAAHAGVGVLLSVGLVLSLAILASSILEQWGRTYNSIWALRTATTLAPGRISPVTTLAVYLGQDAATGDAEARREARDAVDDVVRRHPLDPGVRWIGVNAGLAMGDDEYAHAWLERHIETFPGDFASLSPGAREFLRTGLRPGFDGFLQSVDPDAETSTG